MDKKTGEKRADEATRFKKGNPGGPGRPKTSKEIREMMQLSVVKNLKSLLRAVDKGNGVAMKIYWDRVCAALPHDVVMKHEGNIGITQNKKWDLSCLTLEEKMKYLEWTERIEKHNADTTDKPAS